VEIAPNDAELARAAKIVDRTVQLGTSP